MEVSTKKQKITSLSKPFNWQLRKFYKKSLVVGDGKTNSSKFKTFGYSLLLALVIIFTILGITSGNPFTNLGDGWQKLFSDDTNISRFFVDLSVLGLAGVAVAIGFKTGLFNIGVSGQMLFGGMLSGLVALKAGSSIPFGAGQVVVFFITVLGSMIFAGIAGLLKAYFGIHEVVSTIMLNWIAFFLMQAIVKNYIKEYIDYAGGGTRSITFSGNYLYQLRTFSGGQLFVGDGYIALALMVVTALVVWVVLFRTTIGQKMQMVGKNKDAALAAGINVKWITMLSMMISGAIAGILGVLVFFLRDLKLSSALVDSVPIAGFNGIAIAILAYSNPAAVIPVSFLFGILQALIANTNAIDNSFIDLVFGILLMIVAMGSLFLRVNVRIFIYKIIFGLRRFEIFHKYVERRNEADSEYYDKYETLKLEKTDRMHTRAIYGEHAQALVYLSDQYRESLDNLKKDKSYSRIAEINSSLLNRFSKFKNNFRKKNGGKS